MFWAAAVIIILGIVAATISKVCSRSKDEEVQYAHKVLKVIWIILYSFGFPFLLLSFFAIIPAGHIGIVDVFGNVADTTLDPGINFINPMAKIVKMNTQTQENKEEMGSPTKEGLTVNVEFSVLYHLDPRAAAAVYKTVGVDYAKTIVDPQFRSVTRGVTAMHEAKSLYSSERDALALVILKDLEVMTEKRGIIVESVLMRQITLPEGLSVSITQKLQADQESQRMEFVLLKEKQEAERKKIEAKGISDFQQIVTQGISEPLLRWKGIEATEQLGKSPNSKIIIIGGKDGLPLILNTAQ